MTVLRLSIIGLVMAAVSAALSYFFRTSVPVVSAIMNGLCALHLIFAVRGFYLYARGASDI